MGKAWKLAGGGFHLTETETEGSERGRRRKGGRRAEGGREREREREEGEERRKTRMEGEREGEGDRQGEGERGGGQEGRKRERKGDSPESEEVGQGYDPQSQAPVKYFSSKALPPESSKTFPTRPTS